MKINNFENDQYIEDIIASLDKIEDPQLKSLIMRLIAERNDLLTMMEIDPLTGLYNHRKLSHIRAFTAAVMLDIDDFKSINDTFGHDIGDKVIQRIGCLLKASTRMNDYVFRIGGDEFLIVFTDCSENIIMTRVEGILAQISGDINLPNFKVTMSAGVAINSDNSSIETVKKKADEALYESKANGKNRATLYKEKSIRHVL